MKNFSLLFFLVFLISCASVDSDSGDYVTERIQYDVDIKSPQADLDWWVKNIEGRKREEFVKSIMDAAYSGDVKVYDYFNKELTPEEVRKIGYRSDTLSFQRPEPPYEIFDTIVEKRIEINDITRIRFLEEWTMNDKSLVISKHVLGISPLLKSYDGRGNFRGYRPLFWIYFDERYPAIYF